MVKLVYHSKEFGSLSFEYLQELITVGSAEGNDLVLPDPSIREHHCNILLREDDLVVLPVGDGSGPAQDNPSEGQRYGMREQFMIGDLVFEVQHSVNTTIAIPKEALKAPEQPKQDIRGKTFKCDNCHAFFLATDIHTIGIKGGPKHLLCPKCSRPVTRIQHLEERSRPRGIVEHVKYWINKASSMFGKRGPDT